jgi:signal transduction histidine kinase
MISPQERAQILYEISMGIGTSLNLKKMLKTSVSNIIKKLNCSGGAVYKIDQVRDLSDEIIEKLSPELVLALPRKVINEESFKFLFESTIIKEMYQNLENNFPLSYKYKNQYFYLFPLLNYGFLILVKNCKTLDDFTLKAMHPVLLKLGSAIQGCLSTENLNRQIEQEVAKNREKDIVMFQQARLASIGEIMGNISHQWRQPLNNLGLLVQDIKDAYEYEELDNEYIENFVNESMDKINFMSTTIDNFRNFFKPNKHKEQFSVKKSLESSIYLMKETFTNENIKLNLSITKEDFLLEGYQNEFSQATINILNNAKDILLDKVDISNRAIWVTFDAKSRVLSFEDSGGGINLELMNKIFEPYFTTKHQSLGTGIGLYMVKMIIQENMNGKISVENTKNGAKFTFKF